MLFHQEREATRVRRILPMLLTLLLPLALTACSGGGGGGSIEPPVGGTPRDVHGDWAIRVEITETSDNLVEMRGMVVTDTLTIEQDEGEIRVIDGGGTVAYGSVDGNMVHFAHVYEEQGVTVRQDYDLVVSTDGTRMPGTLEATVSASGESGWARGVVSSSRVQPSAPEGSGGSFLAANTDPESSSILFLRLDVEGCGQPAPLALLRPGETLEVTLPEMPCTLFLVEAGDAERDGTLDEQSAGTIVLYRSAEPEEMTSGGLVRTVDSRATR